MRIKIKLFLIVLILFAAGVYLREIFSSVIGFNAGSYLAIFSLVAITLLLIFGLFLAASGSLHKTLMAAAVISILTLASIGIVGLIFSALFEDFYQPKLFDTAIFIFTIVFVLFIVYVTTSKNPGKILREYQQAITLFMSSFLATTLLFVITIVLPGILLYVLFKF
jgi:hypothetical protein